jgi:cytochrome o ubiquinol oxidase subunit I
MITELFLGKLNLHAIPFHEPIIMVAGVGMVFAVLAVFALITLKGLWGYIINEWVTTIDHKK